MAEIFPFRAFRYNAAVVEPGKVLTQPYDKITPAMAEKYAAASPYNLIPIEKGKSLASDTPADNVYTRAAKTLDEWIRAKVIVQDAAPSLYAYFQEYTVPGTSERRVRKGFICVGRIEDYSAGVVFRHEQTLSGPKADRLELLRHTETHTGQLFMLYKDPAARIDTLLDAAAARAKAEVEVRDEYDVMHRLWPIADAATIETIRREMADKKLVIADGHHRYETALAYRDERRARAGRVDPAAPYEKVMMTLFNTAGEGLTILPTHRVVANVANFSFAGFRAALADAFDVQAFPFQAAAERPRAYQQFREALRRGQEQRAVGAYAGDGAFHIFTLKKEANLDALLAGVSPAQRRLDVVLLHRLLLERGLKITQDAVKTEKNITYEREMDTALAEVDSGRAQICFLLNPVSVETVAEMAMGGEVLPQKSTDFFPKLMSGITMYRMKE
ncbi:MAG TPA: DUF1015 domain-containing protein [Verrucomicrobiae bacterium]|jgi:uncharacterized protein (DUF1015 family)|nr:DUF1015 domain-containing protein [Verrucomicrobiae bacterium]